MAKWLEKEVVSPIDGIPPIEEWQSARCSACGKYHTTPYMYYFYEYAYCPSCGASMTEDEPHRLSNREWKEFLAEQFGVSKTTAKEMLHSMMRWKKEDNFKRTFNPRKDEPHERSE